MCGIFSVFLPSDVVDPYLREKAFQASRRQRHRGPDSTGVQSGNSYAIVQERLSIIGLATGKQPLTSDDGNLILAANGEIYNYKELAKLVSNRRGAPYHPRSDSDVVMALYQEFGVECASMLWGMFGFVIYDKLRGTFFAARDGLGVCSLYYGFGEDGRLFIASEMKCIPAKQVKFFPPGNYIMGSPESYTTTEYYKPQWSSVNDLPGDAGELKRKLELSVRYHLGAEVPMGAFLSGGLNSSVICYCAKKELARIDPSARLRTFSVGLSNSPDLIAARKVAEHLGTDHTEVVFTPEEGFDLIPELVWHLETYDVATIRSAIPTYILARAARSCGVKMILSGEGANEIFGGHLFFHDAPSSEEFRREATRRLMDVHLSDGLRANKASMAQSVELRAPFLGSPFVNYAMNIRASDRMPRSRYPEGRKVEKFILRESFEGTLPDEIIWRQTEIFADGVGYDWVKGLKAYAEQHVTDEEMSSARESFPHNTPVDKESYLYRRIFDMEYKGEERAKTVHMWTPKTEWGSVADVSGCAQPHHISRSGCHDSYKLISTDPIIERTGSCELNKECTCGSTIVGNSMENVTV